MSFRELAGRLPEVDASWLRWVGSAETNLIAADGCVALIVRERAGRLDAWFDAPSTRVQTAAAGSSRSARGVVTVSVSLGSPHHHLCPRRARRRGLL